MILAVNVLYVVEEGTFAYVTIKPLNFWMKNWLISLLSDIDIVQSYPLPLFKLFFVIITCILVVHVIPE
jgi:hypothetical protein